MNWTCRHTRRALGRLFAGDLPLGERLALEQHALTCARCAADLAREDELLQALRATCEPPTEGLDLERNLRAIHGRLDALGADGGRGAAGPSAEPWERREGRAWPRVAALAAAALLLVALGRWWGSRSIVERTPGPAVDHGVAQGSPEIPAPDGGVVEGTPDAVEPAPDADLPGPLDPGVRPVLVAGPRPPRTLADLALEPLDATRRDAARADLRARLAELSDGDGELGPDGEALLAELGPGPWEPGRGSAAWPLARLAEGLVGDADPRVARSAARLLGRTGDQLVVPTLERALDRPDVAVAALRALEDLEPAAPRARRARLAAFTNDDLRPWLVARAEVASPAERVDLVFDLLGSNLDGTDDGQVLLDLLAGPEEPLVDALFEVLARDVLPTAAVLDALAAHPLGVERLEQELFRSRGRLDEPQRIAAVGRLQPDGAFDYLRTQATRSRHRVAAVRALAELPDAQVVGFLLAIEADRVLDPEAFLEVWEPALTRDPGRALVHARRLVGEQQRTEVRRYLELCLVLESPDLGAAVLELACDPALPAAERRLAFASLERLADASLADEVRARLLACGPREADRATDLLLLLHALVGEPGLRAALGEDPGLERLLLRIGEPSDGRARRRYLIEHELVPVLERLQRNRPRNES